MISKSLNRIYQNPIAKDKKSRSQSDLYAVHLLRSQNILGAGGTRVDETVHFPIKTAGQHPEYCVIGIKYRLTQKDTSPVELAEAHYDYKQGKDILCCKRQNLSFTDFQGK